MAFDQMQYIADYNKQNYDTIRALVPKGRAQDVKRYAKSKGVSVSQLIVTALEECYKLDLSRRDGE